MEEQNMEDRIQVSLEELEAKIEKAAEWKKLLDSPLFKKLVTDEYLGDDAIRLTMNIKPDSEKNEIVNNMLMAKATFSRYVGHILDEAQNAEIAIAEHKEALAELDKEEG